MTLTFLFPKKPGVTESDDDSNLSVSETSGITTGETEARRLSGQKDGDSTILERNGMFNIFT